MVAAIETGGASARCRERARIDTGLVAAVSNEPSSLNGNAALSPEMALRIEKAFDVNLDMLLRMQAWHDASRVRARAGEIAVQRYEPA